MFVQGIQAIGIIDLRQADRQAKVCLKDRSRPVIVGLPIYFRPGPAQMIHGAVRFRGYRVISLGHVKI